MVNQSELDRLTNLERPRYSYAEADRIAGVSRGTSKRWLKGYQYTGPGARTVRQPSVATGVQGETYKPGVSFVELIEVAAIGRLKAAGFSLRQIRRILDNCRGILKVARPLSVLRFKTDGRAIFAQIGEQLVDVGVGSRRRQRAWDDVLAPFLTTIEYEGGQARRWWPLGQNSPVVVDPEYGFGLPVIDGRGAVRTEIVLEQVQAGVGNRQIAEDFDLTIDEVEAALHFETMRGSDAVAQLA